MYRMTLISLLALVSKFKIIIYIALWSIVSTTSESNILFVVCMYTIMTKNSKYV